jgi:hypothetical protein
MARAKKLVGIIEGTEQKPVEVTKLLLVFLKIYGRHVTNREVRRKMHELEHTV